MDNYSTGNPKKFVFVVQGEGRGHLTQAMAVYESLIAEGHQVLALLIGTTKGKDLPAYVKERLRTHIIPIESPHFIKDKSNRSISLIRTAWHTLRHLRTYRHSIRLIRHIVQQHRPDILINFYDPLVGMAAKIYSLQTKIVSVAHQYLYLHPDFHFPKGSSFRNMWMIKNYTALTAAGSDALLALSFYPMQQMKHKHLHVCPPLLRKEIAEQEVFAGKHMLVYIVNAGYMKNIIRWHEQHREVEIHCFTDSAAVKGKWEYHEGLYFHSLDDRKFLYYMANAAALVTTAGFESVCEAMFMGKPVMMVPVENHFEQWCNARDAASCGAGIYAEQFDLTLLQDYLPAYQSNNHMKDWVSQSATILNGVISELTSSTPLPPTEHAFFEPSLPMNETAAVH